MLSIIIFRSLFHWLFCLLFLLTFNMHSCIRIYIIGQSLLQMILSTELILSVTSYLQDYFSYHWLLKERQTTGNSNADHQQQPKNRQYSKYYEFKITSGLVGPCYLWFLIIAVTRYATMCIPLMFFKGQCYHSLLTSWITTQSFYILWTILCIIWPKPTCHTILYQLIFGVNLQDIVKGKGDVTCNDFCHMLTRHKSIISIFKQDLSFSRLDH